MVMINAVHLTYIAAASLCMLGAFLITTSLLITDRAPKGSQYWIVSIVFSLVFLTVGVLLLGIQHHLAQLAR